jgi:hypothetical protein
MSNSHNSAFHWVLDHFQLACRQRIIGMFLSTTSIKVIFDVDSLRYFAASLCICQQIKADLSLELTSICNPIQYNTYNYTDSIVSIVLFDQNSVVQLVPTVKNCFQTVNR